jgi:hypothetical protein
MRLACNAPASLRDDLCATSVYVTSLTGTSALQGKNSLRTVVWPSHASLSHLREIGSRAFTLIHMNNPKLYWRSTPCIRIGHAPHVEDIPLVGSHFREGFCPTFVERLHDQPVELLPRTTIELTPDSPPSWETPGLTLSSSITSIPSGAIPPASSGIWDSLAMRCAYPEGSHGCMCGVGIRKEKKRRDTGRSDEGLGKTMQNK